MNLSLTALELARRVRGRLLQGCREATLSDLGLDSRTLRSGQWFWALRGERHDGHDHLVEALSRGASGFVIHRETLPPGLKEHPDLPVLSVPDTLGALQELARHHCLEAAPITAAVTGTNGKTTTKEMLASICRRKGGTFASQGNLNSQIGLPLTLLDLSADDRFCILEMGASERGHIRRLSEIARPRFGVITNVGRAHLQFFGSVENVARAKWELIEALPADGHAILPWGEALLKPLLPDAPCPVTTFGEDPRSEVRAQNIEEDGSLRFELVLEDRPRPVRLPVLGRVNVLNALAAAACAWRMGLDPDSIAEGLERFTPPPLRMAVVQHPSGAVLLNDAYNANPDSMKAALLSFSRHFEGRERIFVLGSMLELGPDSAALHRELGAFAAGLGAREIHFIGEEASAAAEEARSLGARAVLHKTPDSLEAALRAHLRPGVALLFKGSRAIGLDRLVRTLESKS